MGSESQAAEIGVSVNEGRFPLLGYVDTYAKMGGLKTRPSAWPRSSVVRIQVKIQNEQAQRYGHR